MKKGSVKKFQIGYKIQKDFLKRGWGISYIIYSSLSKKWGKGQGFSLISEKYEKIGKIRGRAH